MLNFGTVVFNFFNLTFDDLSGGGDGDFGGDGDGDGDIVIIDFCLVRPLSSIGDDGGGICIGEPNIGSSCDNECT